MNRTTKPNSLLKKPRVLFATAELAPLVRVGGLAEAASGLVRALRANDLAHVEVALPDYFSTSLENETVTSLAGPDWVGPILARRGELAGFGDLTLIRVDGIEKPHPYVEPSTGQGWADNDQRFFAFSAAVAALAEHREVDVLHVNDWHTAAAVGYLSASSEIRSVLSVHNLAYQGMAQGQWLATVDASPRTVDAYECFGAFNPLAGAIELVDRVVAVSPNYAQEILLPEQSFGLSGILEARGNSLIGILNGIDTGEWNPAADPFTAKKYSKPGVGKKTCRAALLREFNLAEPENGPVIGLVSRLVEQKGVDLLLDAAQYLDSLGARLVVLGAGEPGLAAALHQRAAGSGSTIGFREGYDLGCAHRIFAGSDLYVMPSRFEPCGLAQMQAMAYGSIPVTTSVGGLVDTVLDADVDSKHGNGFRSPHNSGAGLVDALHRATNAWRSPKRRAQIIANGMNHDWSWSEPARQYADVYRSSLRV